MLHFVPQEGMVYVSAEDSADGFAKIVYTSKDQKSRKVFNALDLPARLTTHIPSRYEQTVRYYGWYSNKSSGMRKEAGTDDTLPTVIPGKMSSKESRQNWARLIQKIYEVDPLICPKCQGQMEIISIIDDFEIVDRILKHPDLWGVRNFIVLFNLISRPAKFFALSSISKPSLHIVRVSYDRSVDGYRGATVQLL